MNIFWNSFRHHYADFNGRASRKEFWIFVVVGSVLFMLLTVVDIVVVYSMSSRIQDLPKDSSGFPRLFRLIFGLAILVPTCAVTARRLQDVGWKGYWAALILFPSLFVGIPFIAVIGSIAGQAGTNAYGLNPKEQGAFKPIESKSVPPDQLSGFLMQSHPPILCAACGFSNDGSWKYCGGCAKPLVSAPAPQRQPSVICAACGFSNDGSWKYCGGCAKPLVTASAPQRLPLAYCSACGIRVREHAHFCDNCGKLLR